MGRPPDPPKRAKLESEAEELAKDVIVQAKELRRALLADRTLRDSQLNIWTRNLIQRMVEFCLGEAIREPPAISNPYYGTCFLSGPTFAVTDLIQTSG